MVRLPFDCAQGNPSDSRGMKADTTALLNEQPLLAYEVTGEGFLRYMVRALTGTLVEIGRGWRNPDSIRTLLAGGRRADAGATAPPHGLFLVSVDYH